MLGRYDLQLAADSGDTVAVPGCVLICHPEAPVKFALVYLISMEAVHAYSSEDAHDRCYIARRHSCSTASCMSHCAFQIRALSNGCARST